MSKLRIVYILSIITVGVLIALTAFRPMAVGGQYSEVQQEQLIQTEVGWIIQFDIINREGKEERYTIDMSVDGKLSTITASVPDGGRYTYVRQVRSEMLGEGVASYAVSKEGEAIPFEEGTYYLKPEASGSQ